MVGKTGSAVVGTSASRRRKSGRGSSAPLITGAPDPYDLNFIQSKTWLGVPLFHYMSNWEEAGGRYNFTTSSGDPAKVGPDPAVTHSVDLNSRVGRWANTYLAPGQGDAVVPLDFNGNNWFDNETWRAWDLGAGHPALVERDYGGKMLKGLYFSGTAYMQIDGASVTVPYGVPSPMFGTGGSQWNGNTGATFLFVIDQDPVNVTTGNPLANGIQSLLCSRQPVPTSTISNPLPLNGFTWPETEDFGIQYFRNGSTYNEYNLASMRQNWGPEATYPNNLNSGMPPVLAPNLGYGGAAGDWDNFNGMAVMRKPNEGLQAILLEYDNTDHLKFDSSISPLASDRDYEGPKVKLYAMSPVGGAWDHTLFGNQISDPSDFVTPKLVSYSPTFRDWTLFHDKNAFLGGTPPCQTEPGNTTAMGNGFRGIIYEVMMLEGVLSDLDKSRLAKILQRKYPL